MSPQDANDPLMPSLDLTETAAALERGRELVKQAQKVADDAGHRAEEAQAVAEESDRALDRAQELIDKITPD
jgi:methyl-accepting chemotaxis protein